VAANNFWDCWLRFLEHSHQDDATGYVHAAAYHDATALLSDDSDAEDAQGDQSHADAAKGEDDEHVLEEPAGFFDELHSRIAPSRSLKKHLFTPEVLERCVCVCVRVCVCVCVCVHIRCVHVGTRQCVYVCIHQGVYIGTSQCVYVCIRQERVRSHTGWHSV
jgi:hypothetical protein